MVRNNNNNNSSNSSLFNKLYNPFFYSFSATTTRIINNNRKISVVVYVMLVIIVVDTVINQNADYLVALNTSASGIGLFIMMASICIVGQYFILEYVKEKSRDIRNKVRYLAILHTIVTMIQYLLIAVFILVIIDIVVSRQYPTVSLAVVTAASYGLNIGLMGIFAKIFFSWYRSYRHSAVVLLYGLSFAVVVITSSVFLTISFYRFMERPSYIFPYSKVVFVKFEEGSILYKLSKIYHFSDIVSFVLKWVATVFLLYHYSRKIGRTKYWVLVGIPLTYFLGTFMDDFHLYQPHSDSELFYWYLYASLNSTAGGILFGIGFMLGAKHFPEKSDIRDYMIICGFGFILFFSAGQSILTITPYPPYGFASMSFFGLSTYLILAGLYSSAISVSEDIELRKYIKKSTQHEAKFLDSMGTAHMEKELIKKMVLKAREEQKELTNESGGVKPSLSEADIINIVKEVEKDVNKKERK
jgi:hypothetical protein